MVQDVRDLPAGRSDGLNRFLGGSPLAVAFRLVLLSILVGVVLAAIGFDPWNIISQHPLLFQRLWDLGFDAVNWLWRYFLLGAVIVIPIWLLSRVFGAPRRRAFGSRQPMQLRFVGCGDAFGSGGRLNTCFHVSGARRQLPDRLRRVGSAGAEALEIDRNDIDLILITHFHGDHFAGLPFSCSTRNSRGGPGRSTSRAPKASRRGWRR